jgi:hypothetical protein
MEDSKIRKFADYVFDQQKIKRSFDDYIGDSNIEPTELSNLKIEVQKLLYNPRPFTCIQNRDLEIAKFKVSVYYAVAELFHKGFTNTNVHLVETKHPQLEFHVMKFTRTDLTTGRFHPTESYRHCFNFKRRGVSVKISLESNQFGFALDKLIEGIRAILIPSKVITYSLDGEIIELPEDTREQLKRLVYFVKVDFEVCSERTYEDHVLVMFHMIEIDPLIYPDRYKLLMEYVSDNPSPSKPWM